MYSHFQFLNKIFFARILDAAAGLILGHPDLEKILLFPEA
jgi:hypothetical protein